MSAVSTGGIADRMSPVTLFLEADIVVKGVMVGLLLASIWTWAIILSSGLRLSGTRRRMRGFEQEFTKTDDLDAFYKAHGQDALPSARTAPARRSPASRPPNEEWSPSLRP